VRVPFIDLQRAHRALRTEIEAALGRVLDSGQFVLGAETEQLEAEIAAICGVPHAVAVASGTDGLFLGLQGLGVGPGDEVITTPFSFISTATSILRTGARPVFADIDPASFNLDPGSAEEAITSRTRAVLPVDLYGLCADWERFEEVAASRGLALVEDAAQAIGGRRGDRTAGAFGEAASLSFYPTKNLGGMGDGGMVTTRNADLAAKIRLLRAHGDAGGYRHVLVGINSRLDGFQAAVLRTKLARLAEWTEERRRLADRYTRRLTETFGTARPEEGPTAESPIVTPCGPGHVYHLYVIRAHRRDDLAAALRRQGIGCAIHYAKPVHLQPCFADLGYRAGATPEAERAAAQVLALPLFPGLSDDEQEQVCDALVSFYRVAR
jgi:dTDP-4-amino-4,6-dideoxygalactose transaminase